MLNKKPLLCILGNRQSTVYDRFKYLRSMLAEIKLINIKPVILQWTWPTNMVKICYYKQWVLFCQHYRHLSYSCHINILKGFYFISGGIFKLLVRFSPEYSEDPPKITFFTIPFHPNIDMVTGRPCIDFLDDISLWRSEYTLGNILLTIQVS